jgi:putative transposase
MLWSVEKSSNFRSGRHVVYALQVHLVFVPKYRKSVITQRVFDSIRETWEQVCKDFECELKETGWESDHVHLLVGYPPKVALSKLINSLKGCSARRVRSLDLPEVRGKLWGAHFWSPSYCAVSCGGAPLAIVKRYIEQQRGGASSPP